MRAKLNSMGLEVTPEKEKVIMERIKEIGDKGRHVEEEDFMAIVRDVIGQIPEEQKYITLAELTVLTGSVTPTSRM